MRLENVVDEGDVFCACQRGRVGVLGLKTEKLRCLKEQVLYVCDGQAFSDALYQHRWQFSEEYGPSLDRQSSFVELLQTWNSHLQDECGKDCQGFCSIASGFVHHCLDLQTFGKETGAG